jgi:hypothetical protein
VKDRKFNRTSQTKLPLRLPINPINPISIVKPCQEIKEIKESNGPRIKRAKNQTGQESNGPGSKKADSTSKCEFC